MKAEVEFFVVGERKKYRSFVKLTTDPSFGGGRLAFLGDDGKNYYYALMPGYEFYGVELLRVFDECGRQIGDRSFLRQTHH